MDFRATFNSARNVDTDAAPRHNLDEKMNKQTVTIVAYASGDDDPDNTVIDPFSFTDDDPDYWAWCG